MPTRCASDHSETDKINSEGIDTAPAPLDEPQNPNLIDCLFLVSVRKCFLGESSRESDANAFSKTITLEAEQRERMQDGDCYDLLIFVGDTTDQEHLATNVKWVVMISKGKRSLQDQKILGAAVDDVVSDSTIFLSAITVWVLQFEYSPRLTTNTSSSSLQTFWSISFSNEIDHLHLV